MNIHIQQIQKEISPIRKQLLSHPLYHHLNSIEDLKIFMESHVFAVWDFMVLLKSLQQQLTSISEAWVPTESPLARRLINEIVFCEESDIDQNGNPASHYEIYIDAMRQCGADVQPVFHLVNQAKRGYSYYDIVKYNLAEVPKPIERFLKATYYIMKGSKTHEIAAAFTFGREDLIPDLFTGIVKDLDKKLPGKLSIFIYYLERHIEVDGDEHGPMAYQMISDLCGNDVQKWKEAGQTALKALQARLELWDAIHRMVSMANAKV